MGLYLKGALDMGVKFPSNLNEGITSSQEDLKEMLAKVWNNQNNLTKEDMKIFEHLSKK